MRASAALLISACAGRRAARAWSDAETEVYPTRLPTEKEARDSGAPLKAASSMPWFPTHNVTCGGRPCRPGEGNLKGYRMWGQPYIHREAYVQSRSRHIPHKPDPLSEEYSALVRLAKRVQVGNVVLMAAADYDYRLIVCNWHTHAARLGYSNTLVLSMDAELHAYLRRKRITTFDNSDNLNAWNQTCLQRHMQRLRAERQLALAALVASGLDVLLTDATVVLVADVMPHLTMTPSADLLVQREGGPANAAKALGCAVNAGFVFARGRKGALVARFIEQAVKRGMVEFYNRWNNVIDQMGYSFLLTESSDRPRPPKGVTNILEWGMLSNETNTMTIQRRGCEKEEGGCLTLGFLPYRTFPRIGSWPELRAAGAVIHHLANDGGLGARFADAAGTVPFRGHRQRLDRYDEEDFEAYVRVARQMGLWLVREDA